MSLLWWQRAVFYQVYPRSFTDGNGDGIGDLKGLIAKLDYLAWLGIEGIWLSPHFPSPQVDVGYDVSNYTDVDPDYGTLEEFRTFIQEAHQRGIRVILDLVLNHTSDQHGWFQESRRTVDNPKRDWYVWREGKGDEPPNNWQSAFGGSAWEFDALTGQYYYHYFFKEQPDLNWNNPDVKAAVFDAIRFWYELGVDGFRLDAISTLFENPDLPDHLAEHSQLELRKMERDATTVEARKAIIDQWDIMMVHQRDIPGVHEVFQEMRVVNDEYPERMLVGETHLTDYHGDGTNELHMVFNFELMHQSPLTPHWIRQNQAERSLLLPFGAWPSNTLGNHDTSRIHSRFGDGQHDDERARLSLALMLTLRGTPFLYNGEEIGMRDLFLDDPTLFRDMLGAWRYNLEREVLDRSHDEALEIAAVFSRDRCRTPMQWSNSANGGFSPAEVTTWLPVHPNYAQGVNVEEQMANPKSLLHFYRTLIRLRRDTPALIEGEYQPLDETAEDYFAFLRRTDEQEILVVLNFSDTAHTLSFDLPVLDVKYSSAEKTGEISAQFTLHPWEILIADVRREE
jgi:alpha-glucosidase